MFIGSLILSFKLLMCVIWTFDTFNTYTKTIVQKCMKVTYEKCMVWNGKCAVLNDVHIIGIHGNVSNHTPRIFVCTVIIKVCESKPCRFTNENKQLDNYYIFVIYTRYKCENRK